MPKKPAIQTAVTAVLSMAEISKLSSKEAAEQYAQRATVQQRAFAEMGKLHHHLSGQLKKGQTIYVELRKYGIKNSTISNASYASRVFDLVAAGHLSEAEFDTFTFADCYAICRATGEKSKRRLDGAEVAVLVRAKPDSFDDELNSIFETGVTVEEAEAQAKKAADDAAAAQKAAQEAAVKAAADAAAKKAAEEAAQKSAQTAPPATAPQAPSAPPAPTAPVTASNPAPVAASGATTAPDSSAPSDASDTPSNIVPIPENPDAALPEVLSAVDELLVTASTMSVEARQKLFAKLHAALETLSEGLPGEIAVAA